MSHPCRLGVCMLLLATGALAALVGCDRNKLDPDAQRAAQQAEEAGRPQDGFEASDDPPFTADTRFAAGQLAESQGNTDVAITQYREALKIDPAHRQALFRLGAVLTQTRKFDEAIVVWKQYVEATKNAPAAYNNLALCYEAAGRNGNAEQAYKAGIELDPADSSCRVNYGLMLARLDRMDEAAAQLAVVLKPAEVNYNLGSVCEQVGKLDAARGYYHKAIELDPNLVDARSRLANLK